MLFRFIDNVHKDTIYGYANAIQWKKFCSLNYVWKELPHPSSEYEHTMSDKPASLLTWDTYPTFSAYKSMMQSFVDSFSSICRLDTIGYSVQRRILLALKITSNVNLHEDKPKFFYTSTMHGDETVGYVMLLRLADYLLHTYTDSSAEGSRVRNLVNNCEIWLNPLSNPDGAYRLGGDTTINNARRYNANGIDLNRNFPDRINDSNNTINGREIETQAMMQFCTKHNFSLSANFHGGAQVVNYPYDNGASSGTYVASPDDNWFKIGRAHV